MQRGHKQQLKSGAEYDVISKKARYHYCYLVNHSPVHKIKKQMSRRNRRSFKNENRIDLMEVMNNA